MNRVSSEITRNSFSRNFWRDEDGSMIIFGLIMFIAMFMMAGMGFDIMKTERNRALLQSTTDRAILAGADLDQTMDPEAVVRDYFEKAGLADYLVNVKVVEGLNSREVTAETRMVVNNYFLDWRDSDVETFTLTTSGTAIESVTDLEISMVLDVSGSMGRENRLPRLKTAAKEFIRTLVNDDDEDGVTSVSIVPYNASVNVGMTLLQHLNAQPEQRFLTEPFHEDHELGWTHPGALTSYFDQHELTHCIRFEDSEFLPGLESRAIRQSDRLTRIAHFDRNRDSYTSPEINEVWCQNAYEQSEILVHSRNIDELEQHIEDFRAGGNTAIDVGLKWGIALLDPAMRPVVNNMIDDGDVHPSLSGRPRDYSEQSNLKVIVLMTDGKNTTQRDLHRGDVVTRGNFKNGPTRVWWSRDSAGVSPVYGDNGVWTRDSLDGYYVEIPDNPVDRRFYKPNRHDTTEDDEYIARGELPTDAQQLDYIELYTRFAVQDAADFFWANSDWDERQRHWRAVENIEEQNTSDPRLLQLCNEIKDTRNGHRGVQIYSIAFEAPEDGQTVMRACATAGNGFYYEVTDELSIEDAFKAIATQLNRLKLTQ